MAKYVALLRGINVGGRNRVPMKDLAALFSDLGCSDVTTFIQSGNVIFSAPRTVVRTLAIAASGRISEAFGCKVPVVLRSAEEWNHVIGENPYLKSGKPEKKLYVSFLADLPDPGAVARLDPDRSPPDRFHVAGREIFLYLPAGVADSKLTNAWIDSQLSTVSTVRNWATVISLAKAVNS